MEIYLVRHTAVDIAAGICYGQSDVSLQDTFEDESLEVSRHLPVTYDVVYSSPLTRCTRLAKKLSPAGIIIQDDRLKEMNFGSWELRAWNDLDQQALSKWMNNYETEPCPDGESYQEVLTRVRDFLDDLYGSGYTSVVIVTHGGVVKCFHAIIKNLSPAEAMAIKVPYGHVTQLEY